MDVVLRKDNGRNKICATDDKGTMELGFEGMDFYISMHDYYDDNIFLIKKDNPLYSYFSGVYEYVEAFGEVSHNLFTWVSEDYGELKDNHSLTIFGLDSCYAVQFHKNSRKMFSPKDICSVCFCLSGSNKQDIANAFAIKFNQLVDEWPKRLVKE